MRYMLLIYGDEKASAKMVEDEQKHSDFKQSLRDIGAFHASDPLESTGAAVTLRMRNGRTFSTDGPFAETSEQLGGYYLVEATTPEDAIAIASRVPSLRVGRSIEVRPVREIG